jgi:hypothetical protein
LSCLLGQALIAYDPLELLELYCVILVALFDAISHYCLFTDVSIRSK